MRQRAVGFRRCARSYRKSCSSIGHVEAILISVKSPSPALSSDAFSSSHRPSTAIIFVFLRYSRTFSNDCAFSPFIVVIILPILMTSSYLCGLRASLLRLGTKAPFTILADSLCSALCARIAMRTIKEIFTLTTVPLTFAHQAIRRHPFYM